MEAAATAFQLRWGKSCPARGGSLVQRKLLRRIWHVGLFSNWRAKAAEQSATPPAATGQPTAPAPLPPPSPSPSAASPSRQDRSPNDPDGILQPSHWGENHAPSPTDDPAATAISFPKDSSHTALLADPLVGMVIDERYRIVSLLARGGMATVYTGYDTRLERPVAIKVMHPHLAQSADYVQRFRREARAAARIIHPSVVSVFDQGIVGGSGYLVMELVSGTNLRHQLNAQGAFTVAYALEVAEAILRALIQAHRNGVVHRDIKPENVLVPDDGPVKVVDFGLARAASDVSAASTGSVLGTVAYLAPELVSDSEPDGRCDLYALGIMLYEMLTGHTPFEDRSAIQIAWAHVHEDVPAPSRRQKWLPSEIDDYVCSLAARERGSRPESAQEALDQLIQMRAQLPEAILTQRAQVEKVEPAEAFTAPVHTHGQTVALPIPTEARTAVKTQGPGKKTRRRRLPLILTTVVLLVVATSVAFGWWWTQYGPGAYLTVPDLAGKPEAEAIQTLRALELENTVNKDFSDDVATGLVIRTEPGAGKKVHKSGTVSILISKGIKMVEVPNLVASEKDAAQKALQDSDLQVGEVKDAYSETIAKGQVISQSLEAGTSIRHGTTVNLVISKGREPLKVPEVVGLSSEQAHETLTEAGFAVQVTEEFSDSAAKGTVISQDPKADETRYRNDPIALVVSKGPETVTVPNVVRMSEADAVATLEAAGLNVKITRIYVVFGNVAMTVPAAGTEVKVGSTVEIRLV